VTSGAGEPVLSGLDVESERVSVPPSARQVIRYAILVREGAKPLGVVVLTLYAAPPRCRAVAGGGGGDPHRPGRRGGEVPRPPGPGPGAAGRPWPRADHPAGARAVILGEREVRDGSDLLIATPVVGGLPAGAW